MGSRLLAGCLALLLFLTLIGSGVLFFLKYQQDLAVEKAHEEAMGLYFDTGEAVSAEEAADDRESALRIWREEVIPKGGRKPFVAEALYHVAEAIAPTDPETARAYYRRIADQFPESLRRDEALVRLAESNVRSDPERAGQLYSQVLESTAEGDLRAAAELGVILLEDNPDETPPPEIRERYQKIVQTYPNSRAASKARERLNEVNRKLIFQDPNPNEFKQIYTVKKGDVMLKIANEYSTTAYIIEMLNGIRSTQLRPAQNILVPSWGKVYAVVDKSDFELRVYQEDSNRFLIQYRIGIGEQQWRTKEGEYIITNKEEHPPWPDPQTGKYVRYGEEGYPLGERWMGLARPSTPDTRTGLGIHGTNQPETIGTASSAGCVRMTDEDVIEAFAVLRQKSRVIIQE
jgi:lipoprotein-anchoring transpeptidase ErfK/SrfK